LKKNIVLLHGALGTSDQFEQLHQALDENYISYSFDLKGHGKNEDIVEDFSIQLFADELKKFIDQNSLHKPYIFGYSMGGYIALYLESLNPGTFERIMTLATKYNWTPEISERESKKLIPEIIETKIPEFATELKNRHTSAGWKNVLNKTAKMMCELGNKPVLNSRVLEMIDCKCLIGVGDKDKMVSVDETMNLYHSLKKAELIVIPNTQHPIEKVDIERLKLEIIRFFN
jgi:pimeloyl-ACP methyl ester carboxylesterase